MLVWRGDITILVGPTCFVVIFLLHALDLTVHSTLIDLTTFSSYLFWWMEVETWIALVVCLDSLFTQIQLCLTWSFHSGCKFLSLLNQSLWDTPVTDLKNCISQPVFSCRPLFTCFYSIKDILHLIKMLWRIMSDLLILW